MRTEQIPVVSADAFLAMASRNSDLVHERPWVVEGYIERWPGYRKWRDLDYLRDRFGSLQAFAKAPNFVTHRGAKLVSVETDFARYLDYVRAPDQAEELFRGRWLEGSYEELQALGMPVYCGTLRIVHRADDPVFDEVSPLLPPPLLAWNHALPYYYTLFNHFWLLVSVPGALTPLHTDNNGTIAIIAQLEGRKRATLYGPDDLRHVHDPKIGFLDPDNPNDVEFPTWRQAVKWVGDIRPGQVLFVGANWAHHVRTLERSISVSFDYVDGSNLAAYATAPQWAAALGDRVKRNPELFVVKLGGRITALDVQALSSVTLGREVMSHVLRSSLMDAPPSLVTEIRRLYLNHLDTIIRTHAAAAA